MTSQALIQATRADFLDPSLYDDSSLAALTRLTRGTLLTGLSRAFDLAEGRRPGHAQRVAYIGIHIASAMRVSATEREEVFLACLLHDAGMAASGSGVRFEGIHGVQLFGGDSSVAADLVNRLGTTRWTDLVKSLSQHCELGSKVARKMGFSEAVADAIQSHHESWDASAADRQPSLVARIVAAADRVESMIDCETSPLMVRRRGPQVVRDMAGKEIDPEVAGRLITTMMMDDFWFGFYDNDMAASLMALGYGGALDGNDLFDFLGVISDVVDSRNSREPGRGRRVSTMARHIALISDLPERRADLVRVAALLQDIGTLGVACQVLSKPEVLSIEEMATVQMHPIYARDILSEIPGMGAASWWVGCHHERIDGRGYPGMLEGDEVPLEAQIIGICEAYDALISDRPYRPAMPRESAIAIIEGLAGSRFQPALVTRFVDFIGAESGANAPA